MKKSYINCKSILASLAVVTLAISPVLRAQTSDTTPNSKAENSMSGNSSTTGNPSSQPNTLDKTSSKDTTNSLDKNPGTAATDSAADSSTKNTNAAAADQKTGDETATTTTPKPMTDQQFIQSASQGGMTEVELGKLAQEKGSSAEVKQFGSHMVMDHSKADATLKTIADKNGVTVATALDAKHQAMVDRFRHLSGAAFDHAYVHAMVKDHEKDAAEFRAESTSAQDPDVKSFAGETLKTIETHLSDIKSIQSSMK